MAAPCDYPIILSLSPSSSRRRYTARERRDIHRTRYIATRARQAGQRTVAHLEERPPLCLVILRNAYHRYGLKHLVLILVLLIYTAIGASLFLVIEAPVQREMKQRWNDQLVIKRNVATKMLLKELFNNTNFLVYIRGSTTNRMHHHLLTSFKKYEQQLDIRWSDQKMEWDFWNAVIFAGTTITTIGYGHIFPVTMHGKILTMLYALVGIPLVLLVLSDIGHLLTMLMKYPWFLTKKLGRRIRRLFTKQPWDEIHAVEKVEFDGLHIFDIPVIAGIALVIIYLGLCSFALHRWDTRWTLLQAFYFFFISLSTIGVVGDLPHPRILLLMFGFIIIGLSLVSMVINLMQLKMRKTYEARSSSRLDSPGSLEGASLGVLQVYADKPGSDSRRPSKDSVSTAKRLMLSQDGVHWFDDDKTPEEEEERESLMRDNGTNDGDQIPIRLSASRRPQKFIEL